MNIELLPTIGILLTACGLFYAGRQFQLSRRLAKHQFMLQLYEKMDSHNELHEVVTENAQHSEEWPNNRKDWIQVGRLLGLYEHIGHLVEDKIINIKHADAAFSYRLVPLVKVSKIRLFIENSEDGWHNLKALIKKLESQRVYSALLDQRIEIPRIGDNVIEEKNRSGAS